MWIRDWDAMEFDSKEEAFDDACDMMWLDGATGDYLQPWVSYDELLAWAMDKDGFLDYFDNELSKAKQDYFNDFYFEIENDKGDGE